MDATDRVNEIPVYAPEGSIDINNSNDIRDSLLKELDNGTQAIVLDLNSVQYIDSSGLSAMVAAVTAVEKKGGSIALCNVDPAVLKVLEMTRLTDLFKMAESREDALESVAVPVG